MVNAALRKYLRNDSEMVEIDREKIFKRAHPILFAHRGGRGKNQCWILRQLVEKRAGRIRCVDNDDRHPLIYQSLGGANGVILTVWHAVGKN